MALDCLLDPVLVKAYQDSFAAYGFLLQNAYKADLKRAYSTKKLYSIVSFQG